MGCVGTLVVVLVDTDVSTGWVTDLVELDRTALAFVVDVVSELGQLCTVVVSCVALGECGLERGSGCLTRQGTLGALEVSGKRLVAVVCEVSVNQVDLASLEVLSLKCRDGLLRLVVRDEKDSLWALGQCRSETPDDAAPTMPWAPQLSSSLAEAGAMFGVVVSPESLN